MAGSARHSTTGTTTGGRLELATPHKILSEAYQSWSYPPKASARLLKPRQPCRSYAAHSLSSPHSTFVQDLRTVTHWGTNLNEIVQKS
jgi:hypothetical protein